MQLSANITKFPAASLPPSVPLSTFTPRSICVGILMAWQFRLDAHPYMYKFIGVDKREASK